MTSLCQSPHSIELDLSFSCDSESSISLYKLWKITSSDHIVSKHTSTLRLNNRSWRLLNEKLLRSSNRKLSNSMLKLHDLSFEATSDFRPKPSQMLTNRPSLFLNNSKSTAESELSLSRHQKLLHAGTLEPFDSGDETSDISEDDEFYALSEDEDRKGSSEESRCMHSNMKSRYIEQTSDTASKDTPSPKEQAPSNTPTQNPTIQDSRNIFYIGNSPSPPEDSKDDDDPLQQKIQGQDSLFSSQNLRSSIAPNHLSSLSSSEISEDDEYASEVEDLGQSRQTDRSTARSAMSKRSYRSVDDNESEWMSVSSDSEKMDSPLPQPLTFAKRIPATKLSTTVSEPISIDDSKKISPSLSKPRSLLSGLFLNDMANSSNTSHTSGRSIGSTKAPKPVLKRSSTTGLITVDKANNSRDTKLLKPSIMFSKRYASFTDISKKMSSFRSPVLFVEEEDNSNAGRESRTGDENLFTKQTSSVGLSDYIVTARSTTNLRNLDASKDSLKSPVPDNHEPTLSTSLSKYSSLHPSAGSSFKNILSKSSLNISTLFGLNKMQGLGKLRSMGHGDRSNEALRSPKQYESGLSLFAENHPRQDSKRETAQEQNYMSSTPEKTIKVAAIPTKDFEPSVQISKSLRDSLLIDHRLGKIPLPERVISDEDLFRGQDREAFIEDNDDYHSKGW